MGGTSSIERVGDTPTIRVSGEISDAGGERLLEEVSAIVSAGNGEVSVDLSGMARINSRDCAWLVMAVRAAKADGASVSLKGATGSVAGFLDLVHASFSIPPPHVAPREGLLEIAGGKALDAWMEFKEAGSLIVDAIYWSFIAPIEGRGLRWRGLLDELSEMGYKAVGIVALINFLLGLVIAMLTATQLRRFGVEIYVASLVVIGFARELAVVMTGIVVSARTGAAITAELATMTVSEEIDALKGMGLNVAKFLIAPKVLAILVAMPILTILGFVTGVAGGFVLGIVFLGFTFDLWWEHTVWAVTSGDVVQGLVKSFVFAMIIVIVGCHNGLRVEGGARGVGIATTRSVVMDIFFIIVADMIFASIFYFLK